jgi:hypothetical protein
MSDVRRDEKSVCLRGRGWFRMSSVYELIGRLVVRLAWWRFGRQLQIAGAVALVAVAAGGYLLSRRDPPEG